jgi:hypothetical protein
MSTTFVCLTFSPHVVQEIEATHVVQSDEEDML